jgi:hypothetical protein
MSANGTLGALLQGVSQQPPAVRADGTVTEQVNFTSDVVQGLTIRPALVETATILNHAVEDYQFLDVEFDNTEYVLAFKANTLAMWEKATGIAQTILAPTVDGDDPLTYIGPLLRPYVFENKLFLANRDVVVAKAPAADTSSALQNAGIAVCLGGLFSRTYRMTVTYDDGDEDTISYTTPNGSNNGDAAETSAEFIMSQLDNITLKPTSTLVRNGATIGITDTTHSFTIQVSDDEDDTSLRAFTSRTDDVANLTETGFHGMVVRITGTDEGTADDYYLRFNSDGTDVIGDGFGQPGIWEEWYNVNEIADFDLATMPHVLEKTGPAEFTLSKGSWEGRRVGDEETNPFPDLVGHPVRDISGFQSRLVVVGGPACSMSRTNKPFDFFKETALAELDTDPVNITTTEEGTVNFDWIIPFDRDLVFMSDPGDGQYIITGSSKLTPTNASMVKTTSFEMRGGAKPVETGRTVLFPFKSGVYSGIKEFFTNDEVATNGADTITETADRYLVGLVDHMQCSTNFSLAAFKTDDPESADTVWVYKYLWQNVEKLQSSWGKWKFPHPVKYFWFSGSNFNVVMQAPGAQANTVDIIFAASDLDIPLDPVAEYHICLDRQMTRTADATSQITLPYAGANFVQGTGCLTPGREVTATAESARGSDGLVTYTFDTETVPEGATVVAGLKFARWVSPTMPFVRGRDGRPLPRTRLVVNSFMLEYEETGYIKTTLNSRFRTAPIEFVVDWFAMDQDPVDALGNGLRSGILNIPWGERSDWSELTIFSDDVRPTTILEIEWTGQVFKGARE